MTLGVVETGSGDVFAGTTDPTPVLILDRTAPNIGDMTKRRSARGVVKELRDLPKAVVEALDGLQPKLQRFVAAYCGEAHGNGALAAKIAGCPPTAAPQQAHDFLTRPQVRAAVDAWMTAYAMSAAELTHRIGDLAEANVGPFVTHDPATNELFYQVTPDNWERYKHWIKEMDFNSKGKVTRLVLHDVQRAQATLAKILKLFSDAPIVNLTLYLAKLSDADLMKELQTARAALRSVTAPSPN